MKFVLSYELSEAVIIVCNLHTSLFLRKISLIYCHPNAVYLPNYFLYAIASMELSYRVTELYCSDMIDWQCVSCWPVSSECVTVFDISANSLTIFLLLCLAWYTRSFWTALQNIWNSSILVHNCDNFDRKCLLLLLMGMIPLLATSYPLQLEEKMGSPNRYCHFPSSLQLLRIAFPWVVKNCNIIVYML